MMKMGGFTDNQRLGWRRRKSAKESGLSLCCVENVTARRYNQSYVCNVLEVFQRDSDETNRAVETISNVRDNREKIMEKYKEFVF